MEKAKKAAKKVKHERSDPNSKAGMKKETLLTITASKFEDFPEWYRQVILGWHGCCPGMFWVENIAIVLGVWATEGFYFIIFTSELLWSDSCLWLLLPTL